jgi:homoserine dehydrogenase
VVTANKKMLALHLEHLVALARENRVSLLYEAAACGSIPIIRSLEEYFGNEQLNRIVGIFNGTTNYILTRIADENLTFADALRNAQELGFAESNPKNDVEAFDPLYKSIILAFHGFGILLQPSELMRFGITELKEGDIEFAAKNNFRIKLVASIQRIAQNSLSAYVMPCFIDCGHKLAMVNNEFNGVIVEGSFSGEQFFVGKGAGSYPTGAAVLSDLSALSFDYAYEIKKNQQVINPSITHDFNLKIYASSTNVEDINLFPFEIVEENHQKNDFNYRIGELRASELVKLKHEIEKRKIFIAMI